MNHCRNVSLHFNNNIIKIYEFEYKFEESSWRKETLMR